MLAALLLILPLVLAHHYPSYTLKDVYKGRDFYDRWHWETFDDPTRGRVNYIDKDTAASKNLAYTTASGAFIMKADSISVVSPTSRGRDSIRITSMEAYDQALIVANISHMPVGCGTWPAFWTFSGNSTSWPKDGEIDILEGVHFNTVNVVALHTSPNCTMDEKKSAGLQSGHFLSTNCDANFNYNQGCNVEFTNATSKCSNTNGTESYGECFNDNQGGYYITEKNRDYIRIWFLPRDDPRKNLFEATDCSRTITSGDLPPIADAYFPLQDNCTPDHFGPHKMIFDLTFCGDWAGNTFTSAGCGPNCTDFADNHPEAFTDAYWVVDSVSVYVKDDPILDAASPPANPGFD